MKTPEKRAPDTAVLLALKAEAAAWLARLHSPLCDERDETAFRRWLMHDAQHGRAFALVSEGWLLAAGLEQEKAQAAPARVTGEKNLED